MEADAERPAALRCRSCGAAIFWALTENEKRIPMDAEPITPLAGGHYAIDWPRGPDRAPRAIATPAIYQTHFVTCPNAAEHRKR